MKLGTRFILIGKTRHGKNRVREHGSVWEVSGYNFRKWSPNPYTKGKTELKSVLTGNKRWVTIPDDENFFFEETN